MKTNGLHMIFRLPIILAMLSVHLSLFAQGGGTELYTGDVSNTECNSRARGESVIGNTLIKLTRDGDNLVGELTNYYANCAFSDIKVDCEGKDHNLYITVSEQTNGREAACSCPINIYFTIFNAKETQYGLYLNDRSLGYVSFTDHSVVEVDCNTLEQANEEGFSFPVKMGKFNLYERGTGQGKPELQVYYNDEILEQRFHYSNYRLPKDYTYLNAQARLAADGTLIVDIITDGSTTEGSERFANLSMNVVNVKSLISRIRLNHKVVEMNDNGTTVKEELTLYEGDVHMEGGGATIALKELSEYRKESENAYQYDSFLTEGKVWTLRHIASEVDPGGYVKYAFEEMKLEGEAVIDGIRFREVVSRHNLYDEPFPEKWTSTNLFLGEDGGKVYVKDNERIFETMDFTMKEGETKDFDIGPKGSIVPVHVKAVKDTIINNKVRKCLYVEVPSKPSANDVWIEGIGSLKWGLLGWAYEVSGLTGVTQELYECRQGDEVLYQLADAQKEVIVTIDGLKYYLNTDSHMAVIENGNSWTGELVIPETITYKDEEYRVIAIDWLAFDFCHTLTKVRIPKTVLLITHYAGYNDAKNPFRGCSNLESIEVDEDNPAMCSVDGVLFSKDKTQLYCYPAGKKQKRYDLPEGVTWTGGDAFAYNPYLETVTVPNSVTQMCFGAFSNCANLKSVMLSESLTYIEAFTFEKCTSLKFLEIPESVTTFAESVFRWSPIDTIVIKGTFPNGLRYDTFDCMEESTVMYVQQSEVDKFKKVFSGTVLPLEQYQADTQEPQQPKPDENEHPRMLVDGRTWNMMTVTGNYSPNGLELDTTYFSYKFEIAGDTIVDGRPCYKTKDGQYASEADGKVYWYKNNKWELMYDFSLKVGDAFCPDETYKEIEYLIVSTIDTIQVNGRYYRRYHFSEYLYPGAIYDSRTMRDWIEGIGNVVFGPFYYPHATVMGVDYFDRRCLSVYDGDECIFTLDDFTKEAYHPDPVINRAYRPFIEEGKVWKVGDITSGHPVQRVDYYYFDGDTIVNGKTCKQMMCQRYVNPDYAESNFISQDNSLSYVGAWYEENQKVYEYDTTINQFKLMYDFSIDANNTLEIDNQLYMIGPRQTGGINGFKGVYREVWECENGENTYRCAPWLEGVGGVYGSPTTNVFNVEMADPAWLLMSCTVGDEVIYLNDAYKDGATPDAARKKRIDFTHTTKIKPRTRMRRAADLSIYGEYNEQLLGINLNPIDDAYQVRITDETGKAVYEKDINAATIVGLNIDISAYAAGRYIVTVENSLESFTGEFDTQTTGISDAARLNDKEEMINDKTIYNLQGQRLSSLQKGLNIVNGQKIYVK